MKEWTKLVLSLHHTQGFGTIEISWDEKADAFKVDLVHSTDGFAPEMVHMEPEKCINYAIHAVYDAFHKLLPPDQVERMIDLAIAGARVEDGRAMGRPAN